MRILLITPQLPYPPQQGTSLRNFNILRGLARRHALTLLSYAEADKTQVSAALADLCREVVQVPLPQRSAQTRLWQFVNSDRPDMVLRLRSTEMAAALRSLLAREAFDIVQVEGLELAWLMPVVRDAAPGTKIVFDAHNAETVLQARAGRADRRNPRRWAAAAYSWVQAERLGRYEAWALRAADWATAVSAPDAAALRTLIGAEETPITVVPNSIDVQSYALPPTVAGDERFAHDVVFSGKMDYRPNVDAVLWFGEQVWPLVRAQRPDATWAIVGQKPHARLERLRDVPGVTITGWVEDVRPYLASGRCFVMPFRVGSGTRLKLIEALAAGLPIVSTPLGAEGFPVQHGRELLLAEEEGAFAASVLHVFDDAGLRQRLGETGQLFARQYDWRVVVPAFDEVYRALSGAMGRDDGAQEHVAL